MKKYPPYLLRITNYFTLLFLFGLFLTPLVSEAQKLSTTASSRFSKMENGKERFDLKAYFAKLIDFDKGIKMPFSQKITENSRQPTENAPLVCYTITNPSAAQTVCVDATGSNITLNTNMNVGGGIRFVRFTTDQMAGSTPTVAESNFIYSYTPGTYRDIAYVTPTGGSSPFTATYTFYPPDFPNTTNVPITYYVYAVFNQGLVNSTCSPNPAVEIQITVKPKPTVNAVADQYVCAGSATSAVTLTGSGVSGTTYAWTNTTTSIGLVASGATTIPSFTAVNATANPVSATITATPTASSCIGEPVISKIIVYPASATMVSGVAFKDFNENGVREGAEGVQAGIVAKVYNCAGTLMGSSTTDANGYWSVSGLTFGGANDKYRVEFSIPTALSTTGLQPSANGTSNKTDVQFVSAASCNINFGVNYPETYCQTNPVLATPCYTNGSRASNPNDPAVVLFNYNDRGQGLSHEMIASVSEVGAVWGETYNPKNKKLYVSAIVKRHVDLSPNGLGAIYEIDVTTPTTAGAGTPTLWLDINATTFVNTSNVAVNLGLPADPGIATRGLGLKTNPSRDNWAFDYVGKQGIGDIELSQDGQRLYVMDLTNRQVLCIDYTTKKLIWKLAVSTPTCAGGSTDIRPWALKEHNGVLYVGALCSGETNNNAGQLHFYVMQCNSLTAATSMSLTADLGSSITKQDGTPWQYWAATATEAGIAATGNGGYMNAAQPILSDISFDKDENMIVGFMDRFGHQVGYANYLPNTTNTNLVHGIAHGDITRATKSGSTYTVETAPWSFFYLTAAIPSPPYDQFEGGMVVSSLSGTNYVTANMIDPFDYVSAGTTWVKTSDGQRQGGTNATSRLEIVPNSTTSEYFGKANGLGDLSMFCSTAPIQIGNYVWIDTDGDGVQDPCEGPLSNVTVKLYKMDGTTSLVATTTTDATGNYSFKDYNEFGTGYDTLTPGKMYFVVIEDAAFNKTTGRLTNGGNNYQLSTQNATASNGNDQNDSDAFIAASGKTFDGYPVDTLTIPAIGAGYVNHKLDFGFKPACDITVTPSVSDCYDSNGNATGGSSVATVQVIVDWTNNPSGETINVTCTGATAQSINPSTSTKPAVLTFTVPANGSVLTVAAIFSITTTCTATQNVTAPTGTCLLTPCEAGNTGGIVWKDYNNDGVKGADETTGVSAVTVKAYDCNDNLVAMTTTDANGQYTFTTLTPSLTNKYRIEFSNILPQYKPTFNGTNGRTDVQFVSTASCTVNLGINNPVDYCQTNPQYILPCYVNGLASGSASTDAAIVSTPYASTGLNSAYTSFAGNQGTGPAARMDAVISQVGSVWGEAYHITQKHFYFSTFLKRHSGMADGAGYIYNFDYSGTTPTYTGKFNLQGATPNNGGATIDLGTVCRTAACSSSGTGIAADYELPSGKSTPNVDLDAFGKVGTMSFGDLEMQPGTNFLWAVNLYQKALIRIDVSGNPTSLPSGIEQYVLSSLSGYPSTTTGVLRPWALKFNDGKGYLGVINDATNGVQTDLRAYVLQFDPNNIAAGFTQVLNFDPNIKKDTDPLQAPLKFQKWINTYNEPPVNVYNLSGTDYAYYPQPVLSDIEFDGSGNMYLSFFDRLGHQLGYDNYTPETQSTSFTRTWTFGEILKACHSNNIWSIEGTNSCHTGSEFFQDIMGDGNPEGSEGALAILKGRNQLLNVSVDPHPQGITGSEYFATQGTQTYNLTTGAIDNWYAVYYGNNPLFGKANGLGDVEFQCNPAPIQIGNYVWLDTDKDGVQDPCESPLSNVTVSLWKGGTQIASTTTDANGEYYFSDKNASGVTWTGTGADTTLLPAMAYEIRIDTSNQAAFIKLALTAANNTANNGNDQNDNDATTTGNYKVISFTTGAAGSTNHTYDFGFYPFCDTTLAVVDTAICNGSTVNLFTLASGIKGTLTYSTNGSTWTALTNPTNVTPSVITTYYVKDTLVSGCFDIDTLVITVNPQPTTPSVSSPIMNICPLTTVDLTTISSAMTPSVSGGVFEWHVSNSSGSALVTNQTEAVTGDYYLFEHSPAGCFSIGLKVTVAIQVCCPSPTCIPVTVTKSNSN